MAIKSIKTGKDLKDFDYSLKFIMPYIDICNFTENESIILNNIIKGARIGENIKFEEYGNIFFESEDKKHDYPKVKLLGQSFVKSKSNCLVYSISNKESKFNKIFLYQTSHQKSNSNLNGFYGLIAYNDNTNEMTHIFNITRDYTIIINKIQSLVNRT